MQFDVNGFQSKSPSLEEGPTKYRPVDDQNYIIKRLERTTKYQRCVDVIKVILYLELAIFVGWIGCIILTNYYSMNGHEFDKISHNNVEFTNDISPDDRPTNQEATNYETVLKNSISYNDGNEISTTEQIEPSTELIASDDEISTEATTSSIQTETEKPVEGISLAEWIKGLNTRIAEDDYMERSIEDDKSDEKLDPTTIVQRPVDDYTDSSEPSEYPYLTRFGNYEPATKIPFSIYAVQWPAKPIVDADPIDSIEGDYDFTNAEPDVTSDLISFADYEKSSTPLPEVPIADSIQESEELSKDRPFQQRYLGRPSLAEILFDTRKTYPEVPIAPDVVPDVEAQKPIDFDLWGREDDSTELWSDLRAKRSADSSSSSSSSSSSEEKKDEKKDDKEKSSSSSSSSSSSEEKTGKDCSHITYYEEDGWKVPTKRKRPDCGDRKVNVAVTDCGKFWFVCSSDKASDESSEEGVVATKP